MKVSPRWLTAILLVGLALRLGALWFVLPTDPVLDEREYFHRAAALVQDRMVIAEGRRPPASIWYYAGFLKLFGVDPVVARLANVLASSATLGVIWALGRRFGGNRVGLLATLAAAVYPNLVFFSFSLWSESLYLLLALGGLMLLAADRPKPGQTLLAGLAMGAAALTREVGIVLPAAGGLWLLGRARFRGGAVWVRVALLGVGFATVVLPWSARQNRESDSFALVTHTRWMNLYLGNAGFPERTSAATSMPPFGEYTSLGESQAERETVARPLAIQARSPVGCPGGRSRRPPRCCPDC